MNTSGGSEHPRCVIALAGRRVDAPDAKPSRFPPANVAAVRERIQGLFADRNATALVSSAACGADLLALEAAELLQMRTRIVLPFSREVFRRTSVVDRPGDWGTIYDDVLKDSQVEILKLPSGQEGYLETNLRLLHELKLRRGERTFPEGRRIERIASAAELASVSVAARPAPAALRAAIERSAATCRKLMAALVGDAWRWPL